MALGLYVHVPFCASRCGYCDFNTYTAIELGAGVRQDTFADVLRAEIGYAAAQLGPRAEPVTTVFVGGGTPTMLRGSGLASILDSIRAEFGIAPGAEITTEANPDSVDDRMLDELLAAGYTRISFGMQSTAPHVLATLQRTHTPGAALEVARRASAAGFDHVNLDLIYGTPGESDDDLRRSVSDAVGAGVDHVSAYALIVEEGTPLARMVRRGELPAPDDDVLADRYEIVDELLHQAGMRWYEVSNWSRPGGECRHNLAYWHGEDWWGIGPGAHSHVDGVRWWNVKHPTEYAERVGHGRSPEADREVLTEAERSMEAVMLGLRLAEGIQSQGLDPEAVAELRQQGLLSTTDDRLILTGQGRLLADAVIRRLVA